MALYRLLSIIFCVAVSILMDCLSLVLPLPVATPRKHLRVVKMAQCGCADACVARRRLRCQNHFTAQTAVIREVTLEQG